MSASIAAAPDAACFAGERSTTSSSRGVRNSSASDGASCSTTAKYSSSCARRRSRKAPSRSALVNALSRLGSCCESGKRGGSWKKPRTRFPPGGDSRAANARHSLHRRHVEKRWPSSATSTSYAACGRWSESSSTRRIEGTASDIGESGIARIARPSCARRLKRQCLDDRRSQIALLARRRAQHDATLNLRRRDAVLNDTAHGDPPPPLRYRGDVLASAGADAAAALGRALALGAAAAARPGRGRWHRGRGRCAGNCDHPYRWRGGRRVTPTAALKPGFNKQLLAAEDSEAVLRLVDASIGEFKAHEVATALHCVAALNKVGRARRDALLRDRRFESLLDAAVEARRSSARCVADAVVARDAGRAAGADADARARASPPTSRRATSRGRTCRRSCGRSRSSRRSPSSCCSASRSRSSGAAAGAGDGAPPSRRRASRG